jgi:hypothetical protein
MRGRNLGGVTDAAGLVMLLVLAMAAGCRDSATEPLPGTGHGSIAGTVTLLGSDGLPDARGTSLTLYTSLDDLDHGRPAYRGDLTRVAGALRLYHFDLHDVAAGDYFVVACFDFGCGDYRNPVTGELRAVRVNASSISELHFSL